MNPLWTAFETQKFKHPYIALPGCHNIYQAAIISHIMLRDLLTLDIQKKPYFIKCD
jgi:hypothetical protein